MKFKRKMNRSNASKEDYLTQVVCADPYEKKIYVPSGTMEDIRKYGSCKVLEEFQKRYPTFKVEVNDEFFIQLLQNVA